MKIIYEANDGTQFSSKEECSNYEYQISNKNFSYKDKLKEFKEDLIKIINKNDVFFINNYIHFIITYVKTHQYISLSTSSNSMLNNTILKKYDIKYDDFLLE